MTATLRAVVLDHTVVRPSNTDSQLRQEVRTLLDNMVGAGLRLGVLATHQRDLSSVSGAGDLPAFDLTLSEADTGAKKGAPVWMQMAAQRLNVQPNELLYVGDDKQDWRSAINTATFYLHAGWSKPLTSGMTAFVNQRPSDVWEFITHYMLPPPRCQFTLDVEEHGLHIRSLLAASSALPASWSGTFTLQDIFTRDLRYMVGDSSARNVLMTHAISSLYLEGVIQRNSLFTVYPSSTPNKRNPILEDFVNPVSSLFHGYFKNDLIVRAAQADDTSLLRANARKRNETINVPFSTQTNTVHLNPQYAGTIANRPVIVVDDFTTSGMSLEWARNLLLSAGASQVMLLTAGKYGYGAPTHKLYEPHTTGIIKPFELTQYDPPQQFKVRSLQMTQNTSAQQIVIRSLQHLQDRQPLPLP